MRHDRKPWRIRCSHTGIKASQGKYIAFLDSDDEWLPEKLESRRKRCVLGKKLVDLRHEKVIEAETGHCIAEKVPSLEGDVHYYWKVILLVRARLFLLAKRLLNPLRVRRAACRQDWDCWLCCKNYKIACVKQLWCLDIQSQISVN